MFADDQVQGAQPENENESEKTKLSAKKLYRRPTCAKLGSVQELTQGGSVSGVESFDFTSVTF